MFAMLNNVLRAKEIKTKTRDARREPSRERLITRHRHALERLAVECLKEGIQKVLYEG